MQKPEVINFLALERELQSALAADKKYQRENDAKFRAIHQKVGSYEEFRDIVLASHLKPLDKKDKIGDERKQPWNTVAASSGQKPTSTTEAATPMPQEHLIIPQSAAEFYRQWRRNLPSGAEKYSFLLSLGGEHLSAIFRAEIAFALLGEFLQVLLENFSPKDCMAVMTILLHLPRTQRFGLHLDFLDQAERDGCKQLIEKLQRLHECDGPGCKMHCGNWASTSDTSGSAEPCESLAGYLRKVYKVSP
ncbi:CC103 protein, partial [Polypterus senegalus]